MLEHIKTIILIAAFLLLGAFMSVIFLPNIVLLQKINPAWDYHYYQLHSWFMGLIIAGIFVFMCFISRYTQLLSFMYLIIGFLDLIYEWSAPEEVSFTTTLITFAIGTVIAVLIFLAWSAIQARLGTSMGIWIGVIPGFLITYCIWDEIYSWRMVASGLYRSNEANKIFGTDPIAYDIASTKAIVPGIITSLIYFAIMLTIDIWRKKSDRQIEQNAMERRAKEAATLRDSFETDYKMAKNMANELKRLSYLMNQIDIQIATNLIQELDGMNNPQMFNTPQYNNVKMRLFELCSTYQKIEKERQN